MGKNDALYAVLLVLGASALADALKPKCPVCGNKLEYQSSVCRNCGAVVRWKP
jgi:hypothetical protein